MIFGFTLLAEFVANDKPLIVNYRGDYFAPIFRFYPETAFGGDFRTEAVYRDIEVQCLIVSGGLQDCWDDPEAIIADAKDGEVNGSAIERGWLLWPLIPYSYDTINDIGGAAPSAPDADHWLGTDDTARDVLARVIYGFRLSVLFTIVVTVLTSVIGIAAGLIQGYFGGLIDLFFQRLIEVWGATPSLYIIIIVAAIWQMDFWLLVILMTLFGWTALVGSRQGGMPARPQFRICAGCAFTRCQQQADHVPARLAKCNGCYADLAALHHYRNNRRPCCA